MSRKFDSKVGTRVSNSSSTRSPDYSRKNGLNSFLKWFKKNEPANGQQNGRILSVKTNGTTNHIDAQLDDNSSDTISAATISPSLSLSSLSSRGSLNSTATTGFAFIPANQYNPFGNSSQPEKLIAVGPVTDTYRERLRALERSKEHDRRFELTLRKKYNIFDTDTLRSSGDHQPIHSSGLSVPHAEYNDRSLPNQPSTSAAISPDASPETAEPQRRPRRHRRAVSDCSKDRKAGAYLHVKGKRKAPNPPMVHAPDAEVPQSMSTLARKKRPAPQPPALTTNGEIPTVLNDGLFNADELAAIMNGRPVALTPSVVQRSAPIPITIPTTNTSASADENVQPTDTLKLERGILRSNCDTLASVAHLEEPTSPKSTLSTSPISPRPWYKRSSSSHKDLIPFKREITLKTMEKRKHKDKDKKLDSPPLPDVSYSRSSSLFDGFFARVTLSNHHHHHHHQQNHNDDPSSAADKRRSGIGMPNISELDREAAEIISREQAEARNRAQEANDKYYDAPTRTTDDTTSETCAVVTTGQQQQRSATKALINRFEETNAVKFTVNTAFVEKADRYFMDNCSANNTNDPNEPKKTRSSATKPSTNAPPKNRLCVSSDATASSSSTSSSASMATSIYSTILQNNQPTTQTTTEPTAATKSTARPSTTSSKSNLRNAQPDIAPVTGKTPASSTSSAATWICSYCTLENYNWRVICEVCERIRPYDQTRVPVDDAVVEPTPIPRYRYAKADQSKTHQDVKTQPNNMGCTADVSLGKSASATAVLRINSANHITKSPSLDDSKPSNYTEHTSNGKSQLIDSSAVITTFPAVFVAPHPTKHNDKKHVHVEQPSTTNLDEIRAARIAKFSAHDALKNPDRKSIGSADNIHLKPGQQRPLLTDRGSLEREKQRLRDMIREMNAKTLADKYPVDSPPTVDVLNAASSPPAEAKGAIKKVFPRKSESPEDKIIADTTNYTNYARSEKNNEKHSFDNLYLPIKLETNPRKLPECLHLLPSPIVEINEDDLSPSSPASHALVDQQIDSIYAKLKTDNVIDSTEMIHRRDTANGLDQFRATLKHVHNRTNTIELNKLLKNLENAIGEGEHELAARLAMDLARMKVSLSVTKQNQNDTVGDALEEVSDSTKISNIRSTEHDDNVEGAVALPAPILIKDDNMTGTLKYGWTCPLCTLINSPTRAACLVCAESRPTGYTIPIAYNSDAPDDAEEPSVTLRKIVEDLKLAPQPRNDLNKTTVNRKSTEIFNIIITKEESPPNQQTAIQNPIVMTALTENPNITKTKYRGVDNYNPHINRNSDAIPYKSPLAKPIRSAKQTRKIDVTPSKCAEKMMPKESHSADRTESGHYKELLHLDNSSIVPNADAFECPVCLMPIAVGEGVVLRECIHSFCRDCIVGTVEHSEEAEVKCPYMDTEYSCDCVIQEREIRALLSKQAYDQHLAVSLNVAEHRMENAFHCRTPSCKGWCIFEDNVNQFKCPICKITNCLTCRVVHDGLNCKQYQDRINSDCDSSLEARRTTDMLAEMIDKGEAMKCPICQVILMKKWGCDWLKCSMCKTEICWVTRGIRWGPEGKGDTSAGCKCGVNGVKCHPKCNYCH